MESLLNWELLQIRGLVFGKGFKMFQGIDSILV